MPGKSLAIGLSVVLQMLLAAPASAQGEAAGGFALRSILPIEIIGRSGAAEGTCVLIHRETRAQDVVLYFLTAGHLFNPDPLGERRAGLLRVRVTDGAKVFETTGASAVFPGGLDAGLDLAVIRIVASATDLAPVPVSIESPAPGSVFVLRGYRDRKLSVLTERTRFRSTRLVIGDRTDAEVSRFVGGPAMVEAGVFGIVSECSASRVPVVTLLSAAQNFLALAIPGWRPKAAATATSTMERP